MSNRSHNRYKVYTIWQLDSNNLKYYYKFKKNPTNFVCLQI